MAHQRDGEGSLFVVVCPDCDGEEFRVVGTSTKSDKFNIEKIECVLCPTDMLVKGGTIA